MAAVIFDGNEHAERIISILSRARKKLVVIVDPGNAAGMKYVELKGKVAKRLGVEFQVIQLSSFSVVELGQLVNKLNNDRAVDGIMVQLPFPNSGELIRLIDPGKDVDGLREDSPYRPAVVRAVLEILRVSQFHSFTVNQSEVCVVGSRGFVGSRLMKEIPGAVGMDKDDFDADKLKNADVIISATGQAGLIKPEMVKEGVIAIDVGYARGDFDPQVAQKAAFFTPVPGGVGPVTVAMLFKNLLEGVQS